MLGRVKQMQEVKITKDHKLIDVDPRISRVDVLRRHSVGMKAWLVHRISGVGLLLYLLAHIGTMGTAMFMGEETFTGVFQILFHNPVFLFIDLIILAGVLIHSLNGIRLVLMDMGFFVTKQKELFAVICCFSAGIFIWLFIRAFL
jgi:succinate dehydrogenase / fumarate reductase cytochrome b subunit